MVFPELACGAPSWLLDSTINHVLRESQSSFEVNTDSAELQDRQLAPFHAPVIGQYAQVSGNQLENSGVFQLKLLQDPSNTVWGDVSCCLGTFPRV